MPCVEGSSQLWRPGPGARFCLLKRHPIVAITMVREPTVAGWVPILASPNLRHAFALISDEVDASLVFVLRYGLNLREFLFDVYMNTCRNWSSYLSPNLKPP